MASEAHGKDRRAVLRSLCPWLDVPRDYDFEAGAVQRHGPPTTGSKRKKRGFELARLGEQEQGTGYFSYWKSSLSPVVTVRRALNPLSSQSASGPRNQSPGC